MKPDVFYITLTLLQVLSDYETQGSLIINSSQAYFQFCEFPVTPVAVYPLNNETLANDVSPYEGVGKAVGTIFSPGINGEPGGSIEVKGNKTSYVELSKSAGNLNIKSSITILVYVYPMGRPGPIVNYKKSGHGVQIYEEGYTRTLAARVNRRDSSYTLAVKKDGILKLNQWNFIGMTYNYSSGLVKLWHEGDEVASTNIGSTQIATQFDVRIGARQGPNKDCFRGRVACLQFYSTALTQREIEKARIACKPFEPVSRIHLLVRHKGKYIEVYENISVEVHNDKNSKFSEYKYDLGDGRPTITTDQDLIYYHYSKPGVFSVVSIIYSRCRNETLRVSASVTVERPLELLGNLSLSCDPVPFPAPLTAVLASNRGTDFRCYWNFSDGHVAETDFDDHGLRHNLKHAFNATGSYSVHVECENRLSRANVSSLVTVQAPVKGLVIDQIGPKIFLSKFNVTWHVQSGSDIVYTASFANKELEIFKSQNDLSGWASVRRQDHVDLGLYDVTVTATNRVTGILQATETIRIEREVQPFVPTLFHLNRDIEVNETLSLFMTKINEENAAIPIYHIDLGDGRDEMKTRSLTTNFSYPSYGDFLVTITASNNVSFYKSTILIKVHKPVLLIEDLTLSTKPTTFLQTSIITVHIARASDVVCSASFDDIPNYSKEFDLRAESAWDPAGRVTYGNAPGVKFLIKRNYTRTGVHTVQVSCKNRLSQRNASIDVTVQEPVTGVRLISVKPVTHGKPINITLEINSGTNASFEIDFNGYRFQQKMAGLSAFHVVNQDVYHFAGFHEFSVVVWNLVTTATQIRGHVVVEVPIYGLEAYVISGARDVEVNESVSLAVKLKNGSNPEFLFDFNDGSELFVTHSRVADHKFNPHSVYVVNVTARNNVSQEFSLLNIAVVKPVLGLKGLSINTSPTAVNDVAKLILHLTEGSDFFCLWQFGDGLSLNSSYQHLSYYADGETTNKRPFRNLTMFVEHKYSAAGILHVSASCQNRLSLEVASAKIVIQTLVKGLNILSIPAQIVGEEFKVYWSIVSGTNATFNVTVDGGKVSYINSLQLDGFAGVVLPTPAEYVFWVAAHNLVSPIQSRSAVILAEVPVSDVTVNVKHESRDLDMGQNVTFTVHLGAGTNSVFLFDFGDGNKFENKLGKITYKYGFNDIYSTQPNVTYQIRVTAYNNVSYVVSSLNVTVHRPVLRIQEVKLSTLPSNVSENARITLTIKQGSDVNCVGDFGDGNEPRELNLSKKAFLGADRTPMEFFRNQSYQISHVYKKASKYRLFIECNNRLSHARHVTEIVIQEPIIGLEISDIRPRRFNESLVISWQIANGTDVDFRIVLANLGFKELGKSQNITLTPSEYKVAGAFNVSVEARNLVSRAQARATATIQHPVSIQELIARLPKQGGSLGGYGLLGDHFPASHDVTFEVFAQGTDLSYQWQIDGENGKFVKGALIRRRFHRVGLHNLTVLVRNMVGEAHANITVAIQYAIDDPVLRSNSPQRLKQPIKFHLSAAQLGTDSCFSVDFEDGTRSLYGHPRCKARSSTSNFTVISPLESVKFEHVYSQVGEYHVLLNASNEVSFVQARAFVEVEYAPCASPNIEIENLGGSSRTASKSFRSDPYNVRTHIRLDCERTSKVKFRWKLLLLDENGAQSTNQDNIVLTERELNIPRKGLAYGLYEVHFTAQMALPKTDKYRSMAIGYLRIVPSPLVAKIDGGNLISRGFGKVVKIDASPSKDPDIDNGKDSGLHFTWLCRSVYTQFPKGVFPNVNLRTPYDKASQPVASGSVHSTGCYGDGQFVFPGNNAVLSLNTTRMIENETYVVFVIIRKDGRTARQYQVVEVVQGDPPVSRLDCRQNCADKLCPSKRFSLVASCVEGCIGRIIYEWQVYKNVDNGSATYWQLQKDIGQNLTQVKDPTGPVFTLPKRVLDGASEYLIRLNGRREKGVNGKTESVFLTNEAPKGGACFGSPTRGDALVTKFHIWCDGWEDPDMPLSYEFYYKNDEGKLVLFYYGFHNYTNSELPLGNPARDYTLEIHMKILDIFKSGTHYSLQLQSLEPEIEEDQMGDMLANMTSGENSELSKLVNVGDSQAALRMAGAVNSLLNAQSSKTPSNNTGGEDARKEKRKAVRTSVIAAATSLPVTSLEGLQQSADMIASASMFKDETSTTAMNASAGAFEKMAALLKSSSDDFAGYDAVVSSAESLLSGMGQVLNAAGSSVNVKPKMMNATKAPPTCGPYEFTCKDVSSEVSINSTEDEAVELDDESSKSRDVANNIVGMLGSVSGSVLDNKLPGEQPSVISTAKLNMAVDRSDPDSPDGSSIGDGQAGFQMPSFGKLFRNSSSKPDAPVDKQMAAINENPYTWDKESSSITGKVVSLSFKSKGQKLGVSHLDEDDPIDIFIPRYTPVKSPEKFVYNCSVHQGWRMHKLVVDKNGSAVNVEVSLIGSIPQYVVYVRRGKAPTRTDFDWRAVSPNITDDVRTAPNLKQEYLNATAKKSTNTTNQEQIALNISSNSTETLNETISQEYNHTKETKKTSATYKPITVKVSNLTVFLSQRKLYVGTYYIGIKFSPMSSEDGQDSSECKGNDTNILYTLRTLKSRCLYWNEEFQKWKSDGCEVGNLTSSTRTHCRCTHLTAFGSMMDVAPNPIDYSAVLEGFSSMFDTGNVIVFFFIVAMFLIFLLVLVWSRRADKRDMEQMGATPISSNVPNATYHYELTFFTGQRRGAGTTAQVSCLLIGDLGDSGICILKDEERPTFRQGSANSFIISVCESLGTITSLRVWHDNHGLSPAWFLKRVLVRNLQSDECAVFICERWFALDEDDGAITRELTPANEKELTSFSRLFNSKLYKDFTDAHLWFSVLLKPARSTFTRAQRASCCLCLLSTAMVSSAMFYGQTAAGDESGSLVLGPIEINLRSIMIGVQCSLVIVPVNIVVVTIFKSMKVKGAKKEDIENEEQSLNETISIAENEISEIDETDSGFEEKLPSLDKGVRLAGVKCEMDDSCSAAGDNRLVMEKPSRRLSTQKNWLFRKGRGGRHKYVVQTNSIDFNSSEDVEDTSGNLHEESDTGKWWCCRKGKSETKESEEKNEAEAKKKKKAEGFLPYWCLYIAWTLCVGASFTSALYTLFYSMMWGKQKSNQWFFTMILTFSQDTLINQPAKVLLLSTAYAIFIRKSDEESDAEQSNEEPRKGQDEEWLHDSDMVDKDDRQRELLLYQPPDEGKLSALRETKIREKQLKNKFVKLGDYLFILLVLVLVSYGNRDPKSFLMRNSMEQEFIHPLTASYPQGLNDVNNLPLFLKWGEHSLIPHLYEQDWYNGDKVINRAGFTSGRVSKRLGRIRLRQARIKNGSCIVPKQVRNIIHECNPPYEESYEDTRMYSPGWTGSTQTESTLANKRSASGQLSPWVYLDPAESNSSLTIYGRIAFYPAGGYVAEFGDSIEETKALFNYLNSTRWIDRYTRAIIIEGAIYNPNTNLIGVVETALEVTSASAILPRVDFKIFRLFAGLNSSYAFNSACEILFFVILLYTLYTIIKGIYQRGRREYFGDTIGWLDTIFFLDGFAVVVVYVLRESKLKSAVDTLKKDQEWFINFSECGLYNEAIVYLYAFAVFIAILKFIHFLSFTRCVQLLSKTIYKSVVELQSFAVMLFTVFMAYASMAFTIYGPYLEDYRSVSATLASLSSLVMGVFDHTDFTSQPDYKVVGYFFFASFSASMMFIFTNIVITIINVVHKNVCDDEELKKNESNFFNIILDRLLIFTGFRGPPEREEPVVEEQSIAELQWNWHVQYLMENQLRRLNGLVNSIYTHDEMEDISVLRALTPEIERKAVTEHDYQGDECIALSHAADQTKKCEHGRRDNDGMAIPNKSDQQSQNTSPASKPQKKSIETIAQLIAKKTEELKRLEEEAACNEKERIRRIKVINCLQDLLNKAMGNQDSTKLFMSHEEESEV